MINDIFCSTSPVPAGTVGYNWQTGEIRTVGDSLPATILFRDWSGKVTGTQAGFVAPCVAV